MRIDEIIKQKITVLGALGGEYPDDRELIWNFIGKIELENELFTVYKKKTDSVASEELIEEYEEFADDDQIALVEYYRNEGFNQIKDSIIIIYTQGNGSQILLDGHHRLAALVLEGVPYVNTIDIAEDTS